MDFQTMQARVFAAGFDYLNDAGAGLATVKEQINAAMHDIDGEYPWPYLEATAAGAAPLTVGDLRSVEWVWDSTNERFLDRQDRAQLGVFSGDNLDEAGTPVFWYRTGVATVSVFPLQSVGLSVRYFRVEPDLVAGTDTPLAPARFHPAIVDLAVAYLYRRRGDEGPAQDLQVEAQRRVDKMRDELVAGPTVVVGDGVDW